MAVRAVTERLAGLYVRLGQDDRMTLEIVLRAARDRTACERLNEAIRRCRADAVRSETPAKGWEVELLPRQKQQRRARL